MIRTSFPSKTAFSLANWIPSKCVEICGNPNFLFNSSIVQLSIFDDKSLNIQFLVSKSPFLMLRIPWSFQSQVSLVSASYAALSLSLMAFGPLCLCLGDSRYWGVGNYGETAASRSGEKRSPTSCGKNELPTAWRHGRWEFAVFGVRTFSIQRSACVPTRK